MSKLTRRIVLAVFSLAVLLNLGLGIGYWQKKRLENQEPSPSPEYSLAAAVDKTVIANLVKGDCDYVTLTGSQAEIQAFINDYTEPLFAQLDVLYDETGDGFDFNRELSIFSFNQKGNSFDNPYICYVAWVDTGQGHGRVAYKARVGDQVEIKTLDLP